MPARKTEEVRQHRTGLLTCEFDQVNTPGLYIENRAGFLFRIPEDALVPGRSPGIEILSTDPCVVTKISDDPFLPITKARMIAADLDLQAWF